MAETELAWAAGFFDGEGSSGAYNKPNRDYRELRVSIGQKERSTLDRFVAAVQVGKVYGPYDKPAAWCFQVTGKSARKVLDLLWPYLSEPKKSQAFQALSLVEQEMPMTLGSQNQGCPEACTCKKHSSWKRRTRKPKVSEAHKGEKSRERQRRYRERKKLAAMAEES